MGKLYRRYMTAEAKAALIGAKCANCGSTEDLVYHHIVPISLGGTDNMENMVCLCGTCHDLIHYGIRGEISHSYAARVGIKKAQAQGVHFGRKPADYERIMRLIAEHSTQFNADSQMTEAEIMAEAGVKLTAYCKAKRMLIDAIKSGSWGYDWQKPEQIRHRPRYAHEILKHREV